MKNRIGTLLALVTVTSLLSACGPGTTGLPPGTGNNCGPAPLHVQVLYPIPNTRRAPGDLRSIYIAADGELPHANAYNFFLVQSSGASAQTGRFAATSKSEIPRPHARTTYATPSYYATAIPSGYHIGPSQSVSLYWNIPGTGCNPRTLISSFRTRHARS